MGRKTLLIKILSAVFFAIIVGTISLLYWHGKSLDELTVSVPYGSPALWERILDESGEINVPKSTRAVILPHHLITATELTKVYRGIAKQFQPKLIVLVGPNHFEEGEANIQTCNCTYSTIKGELKTNTRMLKKTIKSDSIAINNEPFGKEHSIYGHAPFIKNFFPKAEIIPFIVKWKSSDKEVDQLATLIKSFDNKDDILLIASVDFSHYIPHLAADFHDESSIVAIQNFTQNAIKSIEVDSPASLRLITRFVEQQNLMKATLLRHTNSQDFFREQKLEQTTSHLFIAFSEGQKEKLSQISMHFFGDAMFDREISKLIETEDILVTLAGEEGRFFQGNDYNILNLEGVLSNHNKAQKKEVTFRFNPEQVLPLLQKYGFNVINTANNHIMDYFLTGTEDTRNFLSKANMLSFGDYEVGPKSCTTIEKNDLKIALCGFNDVGNVLQVETALEIIANAKKKHNFVFINVHWGEEYNTSPTKRQQELAHQFIDAGTDLIIGHHPHVIQPMEIYKEKPIFYSLGNFIFDQIEPKEVKTGLSVGIIATREKMTLYVLPLYTNDGKPSLPNTKETMEFYEHFLKEQEDYQSNIRGKLVINVSK